MTILVGDTATLRFTVRDDDTAIAVGATDDNGPIGTGAVIRVVVDRERFIARLG